jgi:2-polyprenyl-6-methoxyphenol hydroxylase-like FAD-dependent oxidoreductase
VTLLGDAAHPSTPDLGQGACQAIESAWVLAEALRTHRHDPTAGLREYERRRKPRTAIINALSWLTAHSSTSDDPLFRRIRDFGVRVGLEPIALPQLEWILAGGTGP